MISKSTEKILFQLIVALACLVPVSAGLVGMVKGVLLLGDGNVNLDSHVRYLSGLLFAIGVGFLSTVPHIEVQSARFQLLTFMVVVGGMGRLLGVFLNGIPEASMQAALVMELIVTPLLCIWQYHLAKRFR